MCLVTLSNVEAMAEAEKVTFASAKQVKDSGELQFMLMQRLHVLFVCLTRVFSRRIDVIR
jgi:hypothetical protein